jgi:uncharacterized membrane protein
MRCPSCNVDNPDQARQCGSCGARLPRKRRNSGVAREAAINPWIHSSNRVALLAYRCSLLSMIPLLGLVLGPAAIVLGLLGRRRERQQPSERGAGQAVAAMVLGGATLLTQAAGVFFVLRGLS